MRQSKRIGLLIFVLSGYSILLSRQDILSSVWGDEDADTYSDYPSSSAASSASASASSASPMMSQAMIEEASFLPQENYFWKHDHHNTNNNTPVMAGDAQPAKTSSPQTKKDENRQHRHDDDNDDDNPDDNADDNADGDVLVKEGVIEKQSMPKIKEPAVHPMDNIIPLNNNTAATATAATPRRHSNSSSSSSSIIITKREQETQHSKDDHSTTPHQASQSSSGKGGDLPLNISSSNTTTTTTTTTALAVLRSTKEEEEEEQQQQQQQNYKNHSISSLTEPKTWMTENEGSTAEEGERCALCFFGLPRAFQSLVLPSIVKNILIPNARHNCDVFVHFFEQFEEAAGRLNQGGMVDPHQIYLLEQAAKDVQEKYYYNNSGLGGEGGGGGPPTTTTTTTQRRRIPIVNFTYDTDVDFWKKRGASVAKYQNTTDKNGKPLYFPYKNKFWQKSSLDNVVRQWHSIEAVFGLMEMVGQQQVGVQYTRVGMFRSDALYMTPIDIAVLDEGVVDRGNRHVVVPGFGQFPVNDRMIYGNVKGVKVWATQRFTLIEERAKSHKYRGYVMHSERFMEASIFPAMNAAGYPVNVNNDICFVRTRADESAMISDCTFRGRTRGWSEDDDKVEVYAKALVESIIEKNCTSFRVIPPLRKIIYAGCGKDVKYPVTSTTSKK